MRNDANSDIIIKNISGLDQRTHNLPSSDQVVGIWVDNESGEGNYVCDILVRRRKGGYEQVKYYATCYDPLQYPLMFPYGQPGWELGIAKLSVKSNKSRSKHVGASTSRHSQNNEDDNSNLREAALISQGGCHSSGRTMTCLDYDCYRLQIRSLEKSMILHFGRLLQQYIVDLYIKVKTCRLNFIRQRQDVIRSELYQGILESLAVGETNPDNIGTMVVLPPSFIGAPRDMKRRYQDAMALVRHFGKPDYFVTMTCNPSWSEIQAELAPSEDARNRPELIARIFRAKVVELKHDLIVREVLGPVAAYQKQGLPHVHFLLILKRHAKLLRPDQYDKYISIEIPDRDKNPHLHRAVVKHMMHGPYGSKNPASPCMRPKTGCKIKYPRAFSAMTKIGDDAFPLYKREDNGRTVHVRSYDLDNRWVVPYNPYLLAKYDFQINVEICSTIKVVKYLYKYIYKVHDQIVFQVTGSAIPVIDEIKAFQNARWISPPEAAWRLFKFPMNEMLPHVLSLQLHLSSMQSMCFNKSSDMTYITSDPRLKKTTLTEYFEMNRQNEDARKFLYSEFPQYYVCDETVKMWTKRKTGSVIGRIVAANHAEGERFFLRMLLMHVNGAQSYEDLRTVKRHLCDSFREAAEHRGLLEKDTTLEDCLEEAANFQMPFLFRRLFATLLSFCNPSKPRVLWDRFFHVLSDDFRKSEKLSENAILYKTLNSLNTLLQLMGNRLNQSKHIHCVYLCYI